MPRSTELSIGGGSVGLCSASNSSSSAMIDDGGRADDVELLGEGCSEGIDETGCALHDGRRAASAGEAWLPSGPSFKASRERVATT